MPNPQYLSGRRYEYLAIKELKENDFIVNRSSGSHGRWDVTAIDLNCVRLIQIKSTKNSNMISGTQKYKLVAELEELKRVVPSCCKIELWVRWNKKWYKTII